MPGPRGRRDFWDRLASQLARKGTGQQTAGSGAV